MLSLIALNKPHIDLELYGTDRTIQDKDYRSDFDWLLEKL